MSTGDSFLADMRSHEGFVTSQEIIASSEVEHTTVNVPGASLQSLTPKPAVE
jgi:hypothetical protein